MTTKVKNEIERRLRLERAKIAKTREAVAVATKRLSESMARYTERLNEAAALGGAGAPDAQGIASDAEAAGRHLRELHEQIVRSHATCAAYLDCIEGLDMAERGGAK